MWSGAEQKYLSTYESHDVAALPEKVELVTDNPWSQCRFSDPSSDLNPAVPADPSIPAFSASLSSGLVSWWDLDELGGTRYDSVGSNDLTDNNTVLYGNGKIGRAASFVSGNSEYLSLADIHAIMPGGSSWTFSWWIYTDVTAYDAGLSSSSSGIR